MLSLGAAWTAQAQDFAPHVYLGRMPCEFKQTVTLRAHPDLPGRYVLNFKKHVFNMTLMGTPTGAVRLEDEQSGAIWIQLNSKSMLMDQKRGIRLVDECQHPSQEAMAQAMKTSPPASLLNDEHSR
jgi:hypothetical protein